jgi:hypothetical protein
MSWYTELIGSEHLSKWEPNNGQIIDVRKLTAFLDLALEMAFLVQKILETEVGLVHVLSGIGSNLFVSAGGGIGIAVEGFQTSKKSACADMDRCGVIVRGGGVGRELAEGMDDLLWGLHQPR